MEPICAIKDIYKILYQFEKNFSEVHAITINEAMLLCCLKDNEAKSAGMICDYIGLSNSRVSKVITSVENKGFIRRNINKEDKRQMFFSLTPKGKEKIQQIIHNNNAPCGMKPQGAFSMYAPQEACGVVFDVKAIVPCRGFCALAFAFYPQPVTA